MTFYFLGQLWDGRYCSRCFRSPLSLAVSGLPPNATASALLPLNEGGLCLCADARGKMVSFAVRTNVLGPARYVSLQVRRGHPDPGNVYQWRCGRGLAWQGLAYSRSSTGQRAFRLVPERWRRPGSDSLLRRPALPLFYCFYFNGCLTAASIG